MQIKKKKKMYVNSIALPVLSESVLVCKQVLAGLCNRAQGHAISRIGALILQDDDRMKSGLHVYEASPNGEVGYC
jgi:hypothetical protein